MPHVDGGAGLPPVEVERKIDIRAFTNRGDEDCLPNCITIDVGFTPIACDSDSATYQVVLHEGTWALRVQNWNGYCGDHGRVRIPVLFDGKPVGSVSAPADPRRSREQFDVYGITVAKTGKYHLTLQADPQTIRSNMHSLFLAGH